MKIGRLPIASIALVIIAAARFLTRIFFPHFSNVSSFFDGILTGVLITYLVYYASIYITAWIRNRREAAGSK